MTEFSSKPTSFPRLLTSFTSLKTLSETFDSAMMSPTSILDAKPFSGLKNPFATTPKTPGPESTKRHWDRPEGISLGLVDVLIDEKPDSRLSRPENNRMVLFGSKLKIQVPSQGTESLSPLSPGDFGIKTRNSQLGSLTNGLSPQPVKGAFFRQGNPSLDAPNSPTVFTGCLSASDMELSEDYTCVISHVGPTPKTTHIFDNCVVDSFCFCPPTDHRRGTNGSPGNTPSDYPSESFLSCCYTCKNNLGQGKDIYMYRGEKAFCSNECRYQEMLLEERLDKLDHGEIGA